MLAVLTLPLALACGTVHLRDRVNNFQTEEPADAKADKGAKERETRVAAKDTRRGPDRGITILFEDGRARMRSENAVCRLRNFRMASGISFADPLRDAAEANGYRVTDRRSDGFDLEMRVRGVMHDCKRNNEVDGEVVLEIVRDGVLVEELTRKIGFDNEETIVGALIAEASASKRVAEALKGRVVAIAPTQPPTMVATASLTNNKQATVETSSLALDKQTSILVMPLKPVRGVDKATCQLLSNYMLSQMQNVKKLRTVGSSDMDAVLAADKQKQALGCNDVSCMAEMGGALGVDLVMYGELGVLGSKYNVNVSAIRTSDATVAARASLLVDKTEDALADKVPSLVQNVVDDINAAAETK
ncbi:MAG TPA: hypothetical protein VLC93_09705 [Myxococcota bacterium]|nr:hypothetical protein [Myxococcota bacterium]